MEADLLHRLHECRFSRAEIEKMVSVLPVEDGELDRLIGEVVETGDEKAATVLLWAMMAAARPMDARHLRGAIPLLLGIGDVCVAALHARGDVVRVLIEAGRGGATGWERQAFLLLLAGWIHRQRRPGQALPDNLIGSARQLAREIGPDPLTLLPLFSLAHVLDNEPLRTVLEDTIEPPPADLVAGSIRVMLEEPAADPFALFPEQTETILHAGGTMRRAVEKVGRNDPCLCGSGRKYKKCCFEKDQERLRHSSEVPGMTIEELDAALEPFLTIEKIHDLRSHKLRRLAIERVAPELQPAVLERLAFFDQWPALVAGWEKIGWREDLERAWEISLYQCTCRQQVDAAARIVAVRGLPVTDERLPIGTRLLLLRDRPAERMALVESVALKSLKDAQDPSALDLAHALVDGDFPGLGALVVRGVATTASPLGALTLFDSLLKIRDRLELPPEDPGEWLLDHKLHPGGDGREGELPDFDAARYRLEAENNAEVTRLRNQLAEVRAELERHERLAARDRAKARTAAASPTAADGTDPGELRKQIAKLESELKNRHAECNALHRRNRDLTEAFNESEKLRAKAAARPNEVEAPHSMSDPEEEALLSEETTPLQPVRVPAFSERFERALKTVPDRVSRAALKLVGRLTAGEPSAFLGMRRLRTNRELCRVHVGGDHRLFFHLAPERLRVVDLINRRDFERWLKER